MWASKVRYLSMIKPNNVWCDNRSIFVASRRSFKVAVSSLSLCCNFFPVTSNALVFSVLMYIFHQVDHFSIFSQLFKRARIKKSDIIPVCSQGQGVVSSAYLSMVELFTLPDTIETRPRYLGWHRTLIISLVVDCDWLRRTLCGNQQIMLVPWLHHYLF